MNVDAFPDHYSILEVEANASAQVVRRAFRRRLLQLHPDKSATQTDPALLDAVMHAFEILSDARRREEYDRQRAIRERTLAPLETLPHVTESGRPIDRARAIFFFLISERPAEALARMELLEEPPIVFLTRYLEEDELIDAAFLIAEVREKEGAYFAALRWYQEILRLESRRRRHRPCFEETRERTKRILIQRITSEADPRTTLEYLRRAEQIGLERLEQGEVAKRRAEAYLELDMKAEAGRQLRIALDTSSQIKGTRKLRERLEGYY
ncbi:MAG: J domain-containing protein [Planctomycetes bacterium]|nr:J domain-containing protein [Planctomycetota bacterium]